VWTRSQNAEPGDLDLHISATHLFDPKASPTGGAIVLACAVTLPKSIGPAAPVRAVIHTRRLTSHYNFFDDQKRSRQAGGGGAVVPDDRPDRAILGPDRS